MQVKEFLGILGLGRKEGFSLDSILILRHSSYAINAPRGKNGDGIFLLKNIHLHVCNPQIHQNLL